MYPLHPKLSEKQKKMSGLKMNWTIIYDQKFRIPSDKN